MKILPPRSTFIWPISVCLQYKPRCARTVYHNRVSGCTKQRLCFVNGPWRASSNSSNCSDSTEEEKPPAHKVLFFGSDGFSLTCLQGLDQTRQTGDLIQHLDVVVPQSKYIRKRGKKEKWIVSPVLQYATEHGLKVYNWPIQEDVKGYDIGVVASFGRLIPGKTISCFPYGILNVHPSLLPKWRGAAPIIHTILNNDAETGVTIMRLQPKRFDFGPILLQRSLTVPSDCNMESLCNKLARLGADALLEVIRDLPTFVHNERSQPEEGASYGGKISLDDALLDWSKSVEDIYRQYRAISALIPLHTKWRGQHAILHNMEAPKNTSDLLTKLSDDASPGQMYYHKVSDLLCIKCKDGWVGFRHVTIACRQKLSALDFHNGYLATSVDKTEHFT